MWGKVLRAQSGFFWVQTDAGTLECKLRGRLKKIRQTTDIAVIGDEVDVTQLSPTEGAIESVFERRSCFSRQQPGMKGAMKEDVLIANLDQVIIVFSCDNPPMNPRLLDRFLVVSEHNEIEAIIVVNKTELVGKEEAQRMLRVYEHLHYGTFYVSAQTGDGIPELYTQLEERTSIFTGPSGVGKSSLLNAIQPGLRIRTGEVSETLHKGRHTTVVAELHKLEGPKEGYVADTPGIRELAGWCIPDEDLAWCFRDIRPFLGQCAFNNCTHIHEPECAVRQAVEEGHIEPVRYESYTKQLMHGER